MALIIPKCNAEPNTLRFTLQVYFEAGDWVTNADLIDKLSHRLYEEGIETQKKEPQSYTKKTQVLSYYGLIEWENPENNQSKRRITEFGKRLYKLLIEEDKHKLQELLVEILESNTFGRNVLGCDSDSDLEAPNIFIKSSLILGNLSNKEFAYILGRMENDACDFSDTLFEVLIKRKQGVSVSPDDRAAKWADPKPILALADWGIFKTQKEGASKIYYLDTDLVNKFGERLSKLKIKNTDKRIYINPNFDVVQDISQRTQSIFNLSLRTKPFMLLAGISGTGKSRIVREMAFQTCPNIEELRADKVSPGNYCLVEVKPNWHDSTELLGYDSVISGGYIVTKFVKFLVKAMLNDDIPFFVCLDEMNLAPVEQYFAEFLSVLESRKKEGEEITSEALIDASVFKKHEATLFADLFDKEVKKTSPYGVVELTEDKAHYGKEYEVYERLKQEGLRIPKNLIVIGTVNMDETTHQFSRKVIDRAMTIEMNIAEGEQPFKDFFASDSELKYYDNPLSANLFLPKNVTAKQAMDELDLAEQDKLKDLVPERLAAINNALDGTPFKIAYRVQNELLIYYCEMRRIDTETKTSELLNKAIDGILMMKVLPRVEGDRDLLEKPLEKLANICNDGYPEAYKKIKEMQGRLESAPFTSFWP